MFNAINRHVPFLRKCRKCAVWLQSEYGTQGMDLNRAVYQEKSASHKIRLSQVWHNSPLNGLHSDFPSVKLGMFSVLIPETALAPLSRALRSSTSLRCLHLDNCALSGRAMALLCAGLRSNQSLQELYLCENRLTHADATHLRALITLSQVLQVLDIRNNNIQVYSISILLKQQGR